MWHLRDLEFFVAVADHESFTRAAEALHFAQPALSKRIAGLEREVGRALFVRGWGGTSLTPAGQALLPYARELLEIAGQAESAVHESDKTGITVGFWLAPGGSVLSRAIDLFTERRPGVPVDLRRVDWPVRLAGVPDGLATVGLMWLPTGIEFEHDFTTSVIERGPAVIAMSRMHPLAERESISPDDLAGQTLLVAPLTWMGSAPAYSYAWMSEMGIARHPVQTIDEDIECVSANLGMAPLPASAAAAYFTRPDIVTMPLEGESMDLLALWNPQSESAPLAEEFARCLSAVVHAPAAV